MSKDIEETLKERGGSYGSFADYAEICDKLKKVVFDHANEQLQPVHTEALDMIFSKISRILNGNPNHKDSWHDIAGYAKLVENWIEDQEQIELHVNYASALKK
jgi:hypothetical protein